MLIDFFYTLRAAKLPVSVKEFLALLEALQVGVVGPKSELGGDGWSLDDFVQAMNGYGFQLDAAGAAALYRQLQARANHGMHALFVAAMLFFMVFEQAATTLTSFAADRTRLALVSVTRDSYVPLATGGRGKINAAYARGGADGLKRTVSTLFGGDALAEPLVDQVAHQITP